jgi:hypothetical protein
MTNPEQPTSCSQAPNFGSVQLSVAEEISPAEEEAEPDDPFSTDASELQR